MDSLNKCRLRVTKPVVLWTLASPFASHLTYLWFYEHQIYKQDHKVVLDVLVRKALATGALCQAYVSTPSNTGLCVPNLWYPGSGLWGARDVGGGLGVSRIRDRRSGGFVISAVEDVVELRDGIAAFDTYWHNARERIFT